MDSFRPRRPGDRARWHHPGSHEKFNIKDVDMTAQRFRAKEAGAEAILDLQVMAPNWRAVDRQW
jgi:hypothetical protein